MERQKEELAQKKRTTLDWEKGVASRLMLGWEERGKKGRAL